MIRWIVNPLTRQVRACQNLGPFHEALIDGEFFYDAPTAADAAMAGRRHNLAVEALEAVDGDVVGNGFKVVGERIEFTQEADTSVSRTACCLLQEALEAIGFEVWREGMALLVLARRVQEAEGIHAWVSEVGSDR